MGETSPRPSERESLPACLQAGQRRAKGTKILVLPPLVRRGEALFLLAQRLASAAPAPWIACYLGGPCKVALRDSHRGATVTHRPLKVES